MTPTLYITRNGMLEPLGQSQVLSYLRGLSNDYQITLISFEKPEDWADETAVQRVQKDCDRHGIRWLPQPFHHRPKVLAPAWSMLTFLWLCLREIRRGNAELIHARSYIPAAVAMVAGKLTGTPFIFDMRALWPEELITAGRLKRGSWMHRAIVWAERTCLKRAAAVVSLTHAAVEYLRETYPDELEGQRIVVIPTCADLERFAPPSSRPAEPPIYSCIGTVLSGWFRTDWLRTFFKVAAKKSPNAQFEIVTRDDASQVRESIDPKDLLGERLQILARKPHQMPSAVQRHTASVMFYAGGSISELGRSPTRMAEILGCGLPVVANEGVGDVASIIKRYRVGVLVKENTLDDMPRAWSALQQLERDPELPQRCRRAAEETFSLHSGTEKYKDIYARILRPS
ncbi:glycosyltransferase [Rhodopirellula halodulae]|uniref:glycosyltransferase n=1 Tax=Rhodopirellula halodulae TaxID=2894198 RepID=UPI001E3A8F87|nr:glycosyltransferase [Rhodopirellula sp. JC737]MCC9655666.1 glycosyltransferase [Rhodopirellula sp. JC737]